MWSTSLESVGEDLTHSGGSFVTGSGSANTKGSYVEMDASTAFTVAWFLVQLGHQAGSVTDDFLIDIATGAAAAEVVIVDNLLCSILSTSETSCTPLLLPRAVASGTRLSVRCQQSSTSTANVLGVHLLIAEHASIAGAASAVTYGAATGDSGGTSIDPGGSANTKGAYVEMSASSSADLNWFVIMTGTQENNARQNASFLMDLATGAAASEVINVPDLYFGTGITADLFNAGAWSLGVAPVSSGTRLSARASSETTDAADRLFDLVLVGLDIAVPNAGGGEASHVF